MLTVEEQQKEFNTCRDNLLKAKIQAAERSILGEENENKAKNIDTELSNYINARDTLLAVVNHITDLYKNIKNYADERKELSMNMLKLAITKAGYVVPDADIEGIQLSVEDKKACIVDVQGHDINLKEGSAYRTVMSMLIRYTLLKEQPDAIQAVFLDEAFSTLSDESITMMRDAFNVFQDEMLIVGIEQRDVLFYGLCKTQFEAIKGQNGITTIMQVNV